MTAIRINTDQVRDAGRQLLSAGDRVAQIGAELQSAMGSLDTWAWDGQSRWEMEGQLCGVRPQSEAVAQRLDELGRKLHHVADTFEQEDTTAARNLEGMPWVEFKNHDALPMSFLGALGPIASITIILDGFLERIHNFLSGKGWKTDAELKAEVEKSEQQHNDQLQRISEYLKNKPELEPEKWEKLSLDERKKVLIDIENETAKIQGRPSVNVEVETLDKNRLGYYSDSDSCIVINSRLVETNDPSDVLKTLMHEGRHAYQHSAVENSAVEPDSVKVKEWKHNIENYKDSTTYGFEEYYKQPIEVDARAYAEDVVKTLKSQ